MIASVARPDPEALYVVGGRQRKLLFKDEDESHLYEAALILEVDLATTRVRTCVEYHSPPEFRAHEHSSVLFKSGTLHQGRLYTCTSTEVLMFEVPSFRRSGHVSLPCFNDLHHVTPSCDGNLLAVSTGLDMVVKFTEEGRLLSEWGVLGDDPWVRFSRRIDYRRVDSTKPHRSHPNFVFELGPEVWVTRFAQRDAICLTAVGKRIGLPGEAPHDGVVAGEDIYFTSVDGKILIASRHNLRVERTIDLNTMEKERTEPGWCRGLMPLDNRRLWVGFTRVRKTRFKENILWVKHAFQEMEKPSHIALYDLALGHCLREIDLEQHGMNVIFGIYPAPQKAVRPLD